MSLFVGGENETYKTSIKGSFVALTQLYLQMETKRDRDRKKPNFSDTLFLPFLIFFLFFLYGQIHLHPNRNVMDDSCVKRAINIFFCFSSNLMKLGEVVVHNASLKIDSRTYSPGAIIHITYNLE